MSRDKDDGEDTIGKIVDLASKRPIGSADDVRARVGNVPTIRITPGELDLVTDMAEQSLIDAGRPVFQRGHDLVRPALQEVSASHGRTVTAAALGSLGAAAVVDMLCSTAEWERYDGRAKAWVRADPPTKVAETLLSRHGYWKVPTVAGIINTPTLRPDGSVLSEPGYDAATRLYHAADPSLALHASVARPTREDAVKALALLDRLVSGFPFVDGVSRAVGYSGLITPVIRGALPNAPMTAFRASTAGSGKSYMADTASAIATGRPCPVIAAAPDDESETEKRLTGLLLAGYSIISLDNVNGELGGDLLCQALDRPLLRVRSLGRSDIFEIESRATIFATGNNLRVRGDMTRRSLISDLDAGVERPEMRTFKFDPVERVIQNRGRYVSACLIIVRAYIQAGSPGKLSPIASFEAWSDLVRSALVWLGCDDPVKSMETAREEDSSLNALREVMAAWHDAFGTGVRTIKKAVGEATELTAKEVFDDDGNRVGDGQTPRHADLVATLRGVAPAPKNEIDNKRLGIWLLSIKGRVVGIPAGLRRFHRLPTLSGGSPQWKLQAKEGEQWV